MRQIKFRARDLNGYVIYGGISRNGRAIVLDDYGSCAQVDPASIQQFVGVDSNGKEVYEGDTLKRFDELDADDTLSATFEDYGDILNGTLILAEAQL